MAPYSLRIFSYHVSALLLAISKAQEGYQDYFGQLKVFVKMEFLLEEGTRGKIECKVLTLYTTEFFQWSLTTSALLDVKR